MKGDAKYHAFISYSRDDQEIAAALQTTLSKLMRRPLRRNHLRIFRDVSAMSPSDSLALSISSALHDSEWLIVLLSPASARSRWVNEEVRLWAETHPRELRRLLLVRCDETIDLRWHDGSPVAPESMPPALATYLDGEPSYVDVDAQQPEWERPASIALASAIMGRAPDEIAGDDLRQHRRAKRMAGGAVAALTVLLVLAVVLGLVSLAKSHQADRARATAESQRTAAQQFAQLSESRRLSSSAPEVSLGLAIAASRTPRATDAVELLREQLRDLGRGITFGTVPAGALAVVPTADDRIDVLYPQRIVTFGLPRLDELGSTVVDDVVGDGALLRESSSAYWVVSAPSTILRIPRGSDGAVERLTIAGRIEDLAADEAGARVLLVEAATNQTRVVELNAEPDGLSVGAAEDLVPASAGFATTAHFDADGEHIVVAGMDLLLVIDVARLNEGLAEATLDLSRSVENIDANAADIVISKDNRYVIAVGGDRRLTALHNGVVDVISISADGEADVRESEVGPTTVTDVMVCGGDAVWATDTVDGVGARTFPILDRSSVFHVCANGGSTWLSVSDQGRVRSALTDEFSGDQANAASFLTDTPGAYELLTSDPAEFSIIRGTSELTLDWSGERVAVSGTVQDSPAVAGVVAGDRVTAASCISLAQRDFDDLSTDSETVLGVCGGRTFVYSPVTQSWIIRVPGRGDIVRPMLAGFAISFAVDDSGTSLFDGNVGRAVVVDLSDLGAPTEVDLFEPIGDVFERGIFMSDGSLLTLDASRQGDYVSPYLYPRSRDALVRIACVVGATIPADAARALGLDVGRPAECEP